MIWANLHLILARKHLTKLQAPPLGFHLLTPVRGNFIFKTAPRLCHLPTMERLIMDISMMLGQFFPKCVPGILDLQYAKRHYGGNVLWPSGFGQG